MNLVPWLPDAFIGDLFINSLCTHTVFERSTDKGTSSDSHGGLLEQVTSVLATQKQEKLSINNYLLEHIGITIIYPIYL